MGDDLLICCFFHSNVRYNYRPFCVQLCTGVRVSRTTTEDRKRWRKYNYSVDAILKYTNTLQ